MDRFIPLQIRGPAFCFFPPKREAMCAIQLQYLQTVQRLPNVQQIVKGLSTLKLKEYELEPKARQQ